MNSKKMMIIDPDSNNKYNINITRESVDIEWVIDDSDKPEEIITLPISVVYEFHKDFGHSSKVGKYKMRVKDDRVVFVGDGVLDVPVYIAHSILINVVKYYERYEVSRR